MSDAPVAWLDGFNHAAVSYLIHKNLRWTNGVSSQGEIKKHMSKCSVTRVHYVTQEMEEVSIQEADYSITVSTQSVIISAFACRCNKYSDQRLGIIGNFADVVSWAAKK